MEIKALIRRALVIVDRELRREFPSDFHKRCYYSTTALTELVRSSGHQAAIKGGDMAGFMVSRDGSTASLEGFGGSRDGFSHVWVEAAGRTIDLGFHYLPEECRFVAAEMPAAMWGTDQGIPEYMQHLVLLDNTEQGSLAFQTAEHNARLATFVERCRYRFRNQVGNPKVPFWLLETPQSVQDAAARGDPWAKAAVRFEGMKGAKTIGRR